MCIYIYNSIFLCAIWFEKQFDHGLCTDLHRIGHREYETSTNVDVLNITSIEFRFVDIIFVVKF